MNIDEVPWDRIVHFYGRASDVPAAIDDLAGDRHVSAERALLQNLEHQDGVIQATPVAVQFIVQALNEGRVRDRRAVERLLTSLLEAARFQISGNESLSTRSTVEEILAPENLWPEFESEDEDEVLWEEWSPSKKDLAGWALLTEELVAGAGIVPVGQEPEVPADAARTIRQKPWWRFW
jgi:hypothetical protein